MELGQTICLPRTPRCEQCPVEHLCEARRRDVVHCFPARRRRHQAERVRLCLLLVHDRQQRLLLERGVFAHLDHLWLPLSQLGCERRSPPAAQVRRGSFRHAIQTRLFEVEVSSQVVSARDLRRRVRLPVRAGSERRIFTRDELQQIGRSSLLTKALALLARRGRTA
jgi:adenine-specific DNA glycosylase